MLDRPTVKSVGFIKEPDCKHLHDDRFNRPTWTVFTFIDGSRIMVPLTIPFRRKRSKIDRYIKAKRWQSLK